MIRNINTNKKENGNEPDNSRACGLHCLKIKDISVKMGNMSLLIMLTSIFTVER